VVEFADGHESDAAVLKVMPEHDSPCCRRDRCEGRWRPPRCARLPTCSRATRWLRSLSVRHRAVGIGRRDLRAGARVPLARRQAHAGQPDQFDAAANPGNSGGRWSPWTARWSASSPRSSTRPRAHFIGIGFAVPIENAAAVPASILLTGANEPDESQRDAVASTMERILFEVKKVVVGQDHFLERVLVATLAQGTCWSRRAGAGQDADREDARRHHLRRLQADPVHAGSRAGRPRRHAHLQQKTATSPPRSGRCSPTCCWPTRSTARRPRCRARCSSDAGAAGDHRGHTWPVPEPSW